MRGYFGSAVRWAWRDTQRPARQLLDGLVTAALAVVIVGAAGAPWRYAALALLASPVKLLGIFLWQLGRALRGHREPWEAQIALFGLSRTVLVGLRAPLGTSAGPGPRRCVLRTPDGSEWTAEHDLSFSTVGGVSFQYPINFPGAPLEVTSGPYRAIWFEESRAGRWVEFLRHRATVEVPFHESPTPEVRDSER